MPTPAARAHRPKAHAAHHPHHQVEVVNAYTDGAYHHAMHPRSVRAHRRCVYCGHACRGVSCTFHRDLPRLDVERDGARW